jgi:hypothetical protein
MSVTIQSTILPHQSYSGDIFYITKTIKIKNFMKSLKSFDILIKITPLSGLLTQDKLVNV